MPSTEPRLVCIQQALEPGGLCVAGCGPYSFEICRMPDHTGYALQMRRLQPDEH
jgi:hypothetical protein